MRSAAIVISASEGNGFVQKPLYNPANPGSQPSLILVKNARFNQLSQTGVFQSMNPAATTTSQLNAAGTGLVPFNLPSSALRGLPFRSTTSRVATANRSYAYNNLRAPVRRNVATGAFMYDITDDTHMSLDLSYGKVETDNRSRALVRNFDSITPKQRLHSGQPDSAERGGQPGTFTQQGLDLKPVALLALRTPAPKVKRVRTRLRRQVRASRAGRDDGYTQYGNTKREQIVADNRHLNAYNLAIDSIIGPNGTPICRISSAAPGDRPLA